MRSFVPAAQDRLAAAYQWARSPRPVPDVWISHAVEMGRSPSKTYVAALLTAALARATTSEVDAQWLKVTSDPRSYSARTLCHQVLVRPQISLASASERQAASHSTTSRSSGTTGSTG